MLLSLLSFNSLPICPRANAVTSTLIGGGGDILIFAFYPSNFFWNQFFRLISQEFSQAEHKYVNIPALGHMIYGPCSGSSYLLQF